MSVTLQSLIDQAVAIGHIDQPFDAEIQVEALVQRTIDAVTDDAAADVERRQYTLDTIALSISAGNAALPTKARVKCLKWASVADPLDANMARKMKWVKLWSDFVRPLPATGIGYFTALGTTFYMTKPGTAFSPSSGYTGTINVTMPCAPQVGTLSTDTITIAPELEKDVVMRLVEELRKAVVKQ